MSQLQGIFYGPFPTNTPVVLSYYGPDGTSYIAASDSKSNVSYVSALATPSGYSPVYFYVETIKLNSNKMVVYFNNGINSLSLSPTNQLQIGEQGTEFTLVSPNAAFWTSDSLLANVGYQLQTVNGTNLSMPIVGGTSTSTTFLAPLQWYNNCNSDGTFQSNMPQGYVTSDIVSTGLPNTLFVIACQSPAGATSSSCTGVPTNVWVDVNYCTANNTTPYCGMTGLCTSSCAGPCQASEDICIPTGNQGGKCSLDPNRLFSGNWWTDTWFIVTISIIGVLIIIGIIVTIYIIRYIRSRISEASEGITT